MDPDFSCAIHVERTAAARCPECRCFYCAECVAEHAGRMLCAACIARFRSAPRRSEGAWRRVRGCAAAAAGLLISWGIYLWVGSGIASLPDPEHQRDLWRETPLQSP